VFSSHRIATSSLVLQDMQFVIIPLLQSALSVSLKNVAIFCRGPTNYAPAPEHRNSIPCEMWGLSTVCLLTL
jgi:hypothetical protein